MEIGVFGGILLYEGSDGENRFSSEDLRSVDLGFCSGRTLSLVRTEQNNSADLLSATRRLANASAFKAAQSARRSSLV